MMQIITPTGDRPAAWKLCQWYVARQTYTGPVVWHVVDDGVEPMPVEFARDDYMLTVHRLQPVDGNSQSRNMRHLLRQVDPRHPVVIWEDDDWYAPDWLATVAEIMRHGELVGEMQSRYYNVAVRRARQLRNSQHASLCSTAVRGYAVDALMRACESGTKFIDIELWRHFRRLRHLFGGHRVVGIKGLPGRGGIGMGHSADFQGDADPQGALLRRWIGVDAEAYL